MTITRFILPVLTACALALGAAAPAAAQDESLACGADPAAWFATHAASMDGFWSAQSDLFILNGENMGMSFAQTVSVTPVPYGLRLEGPDFEMPITMTLTDIAFDLAPPPGVVGLSGEDIEIVLGCEASRLPRLLSQQTVTIDGMQAEVTYTAVMTSPREMYFWFVMSTGMGDILQFWVLDR